jgi:hypothetical protein
MKAVTVAPGTAGRCGWRGFPSRAQLWGLVLVEALAAEIKASERAADQIKVVSGLAQPGTVLAGWAEGTRA